MKRLLWVGLCAGLTLPICAQQEAKAAAANGVSPTAGANATKLAVTNGVSPKAGADETKPTELTQGRKPGSKALSADAGADLRVRQEVLGNMPEKNGTPLPNQNYIRYRPRVWGSVENEDFKLYMRVADEMRSYTEPNVPNYRWPDEAFLDNLYLDLYNLLDDHLDLRIGRQDFFGPNGPMYGAGRVIADGTPLDGSRSIYMDAIRATVKFDEKNALDVLGIYNDPYNPLSIGESQPYGDQDRPLIDPYNSEKEWGGGLYFKSKEFKELPYELYYLYKRETKALTARTCGTSKDEDGRDTHTWGVRVMPKITETLSAEVESAVQAGQKDSGPSTSGYMEYGGLTYRPEVDYSAKPFFTGAIYYLSGDKNEGEGHNDTAWDPLWSRWPQFSELYAYNTIYGPGYWSNLIYPHAATGVDIAPGHKVSSSIGPMFAAEEDGLGGGDGDMRGWLGTLRYDFPLAKKIFGKRGELFGHVMAEVLDPGDYYTSDQWAYFLRWEVSARF